jgi:hypothetical protein
MATKPHPAPRFASALLWNPAGGWQWFLGDGWIWCPSGGWIEHHEHPWWRQMPLDGLYVAGSNGRWIPTTTAMIERHPILQFLPVQLQLLSVIDPGGNLLVTDKHGRLHDAAAKLPDWLSRSLTPKPLDAGERADLERLMRLEPPVSRTAARKLIRGGTERLRRILRELPDHWKLRRGRQPGHRLSVAAATLIELRKK